MQGTSRFTNDFLSCGYIVKCTPTWISYANFILCGIKFVSEGLSVDECQDLSDTISNVRKVAESIPYMKMVHSNTRAVLGCMEELEKAITFNGSVVFTDEVKEEEADGEEVGAVVEPPTAACVNPDREKRLIAEVNKSIADHFAGGLDKVFKMAISINHMSYAISVYLKSADEHLKRVSIMGDDYLKRDWLPEVVDISDSEFEGIVSRIRCSGKDTVSDLQCVLSMVNSRRFTSRQLGQISDVFVDKYIRPDYEAMGLTGGGI
jgi:hypothetical protein